ncbi:hypothetical protein GCM10010389_05720 [Streptomyces echinoruber]|uniref:Uncharacterized protein n=1 Tax=Streptomyces echinoruber TaxID=68898 RepID=A0A918QV62_9ACTN|nr:hypothetical protein GCM10010389_05720 [Streptomyces echinoruber]
MRQRRRDHRPPRGDRNRPGSVAVGALFRDERLTPTVITAFALILAGSVQTTAAERPARPVAWSPRQTSRADGRVEFPQRGLPEERPGSTGQGGG